MNVFAEILATVLDVIFMVWFISKFNHVSFREKLWTLIFPCILLSFQLTADQYLSGLPGFDLFYMIVIFSFAFLYALFQYRRGKFLRALLSSCLYVLVLMLSGSFLHSVFSLCVDSIDCLVQGAATDARFIYISIGKLLQFSLYKLLLYIFRADETLDLKNSLLVFLLTLFTAGGLGLLMHFSVLPESSNFRFGILAMVLLLIVSNVALYLMIYQIQRLLRDRYELKLLQEKMTMEASRVADAAASFDRLQKIRHDLKNHFGAALEQLNAGCVEDCKNYLGRLSCDLDDKEILVRSNNPVLDYLINSKLSHLKDTQVHISGYVGNLEDIDDVDLVSILGNILDNAVEAQQTVTSQKRIELYFFTQNSNRIILLQNSIDGSVLKTNRKLRSTKKSRCGEHGLGHKILESAVSKYNGFVEYFEEDGMFGVQIVLPLPVKKE